MADGARHITDEKDEMPWVVAEKILSDMQRAGSGTWKSSVSSDGAKLLAVELTIRQAWLINLAHVVRLVNGPAVSQTDKTLRC